MKYNSSHLVSAMLEIHPGLHLSAKIDIIFSRLISRASSTSMSNNLLKSRLVSNKITVAPCMFPV